MPKKNKRKDKNPGKPKHGGRAGPSTSSHVNVQYLENPVKPENDGHEYRVIALPNGLVASLISSPNKEFSDRDKPNTYEEMISGRDNYPYWYKTAMVHRELDYAASVCCVCINVGTFSDPRQVPGVSRVLNRTFEKPIFKKDLEISDDYKKLVRYMVDEDGDITDNIETTVIGFWATQRLLREAIHLLAQSFACFVTTRHQVEMKRDAVERTYYEDLEDSGFMEHKATEYIFTQLVASRHPVKTVGKHYLEGLCQTSDEKLYKEVLKFRKRHYSANRMTVVIKAGLPLDTLENFATEFFSKIPSNGLPPQNFNPYNFANSFENSKFRRIWKKTLRIDNDNLEMEVTWVMPPSSWLYRSKSLEYLRWIFENKCAGSLMSYLKKKNWTIDVSGGVREGGSTNNSLYSIFAVTVRLTKAGNENKDKVLDAIYSYVNMLRREGPQERIYNEIRIIEDAKFRYSGASLSRGEYDCEKLSADMHLYPPTDYLTGPFLYYEYDPVSITTCMDLMTPTKGCIIVSDNKFGKHPMKTLSASDKYNYESTAIPEDWIERWKTIEPFTDFKLPEVNVYCPNDFTLFDAPEILLKYPVKVHSDNMTEVWYKFDGMSGAPKCRINFCYVSPLSVDSLEKNENSQCDTGGLILE